MNYGETIKLLIRHYDITIAKLAEIAEIPRNTLYTIIERDSGKIKKDVLERILYAFDIKEEVFENIRMESDSGKNPIELYYENHIMISKLYDSDQPVYKLEIKGLPLEALRRIALGNDVKYEVERDQALTMFERNWRKENNIEESVTDEVYNHVFDEKGFVQGPPILADIPYSRKEEYKKKRIINTNRIEYKFI